MDVNKYTARNPWYVYEAPFILLTPRCYPWIKYVGQYGCLWLWQHSLGKERAGCSVASANFLKPYSATSKVYFIARDLKIASKRDGIEPAIKGSHPT